MQTGGKIIAATVALAVAACTSAPAINGPRDASFAWGCWVEKDQPGGRIQAFLRLLKNGSGGKLYEGYLHDVRGSDMIPVLHLALARDGTSAVVTRDDDTTEFFSAGATSDGIRLNSSTPGKAGSLSLSGGNDQLTLAIQIGADSRDFVFERDGCD